MAGAGTGAAAGGGRTAVVVGCGIVGISVALHLQRAGFNVTAIDRDEPGRGCSYGNLGGIAVTEVVPQSVPGLLGRVPGWLIDPVGPLRVRWSALATLTPWLVRFLRAGRRAEAERIASDLAGLMQRADVDHRDLMRDAGIEHMLAATDAVAVYDTEAEIARDAWAFELRSRLGWPCTRVSGGELRDLEPELADDFAGGMIYNGWRHISDPYRMIAAYAELLVRRGGRIARGEVVAFEYSGPRVSALRLKDGRSVAVGEMVIAAGARSHELARLLGDRVVLAAERGYHTMIADPGIDPHRKVMYPPQGFGITPMADGLRIGGTVELTDQRAPANFARARVLVEKAGRVFPGLRETKGQEWSGDRPATPDSLPVISRAGRYENVHYGFGHGHLGLTLGPTTGRLLATLIAGRLPNIDLAPYRAGRFSRGA